MSRNWWPRNPSATIGALLLLILAWSSQTASLRFTAFAARTTPKLDGTLSNISAAQFTDQQNRSYFTAQIEVSAQELKKLGGGHALKPGMPTEVYIETNSRSILSYFVKLLGDLMSRSLRET